MVGKIGGSGTAMPTPRSSQGRSRCSIESPGASYEANTVALVAVRTPNEYRVVILPVADAEAAAQINLNHAFRTLMLNGGTRSPDAKASVYLDRIPNVRDATRQPLLEDELKILRPYIDTWNI